MLAIGAAAAAVVTLAVAGSTLSSLMGWSARPQTPAALERMLSEGFAFSPPPGAATGARAPTALLLSGCDGPKDNLPRWTAALNAAGWATLVVDSHGPRGLDADQRWRLVCAGQVLPGPERAGDVAVAIDAARRAADRHCWPASSAVLIAGGSCRPTIPRTRTRSTIAAVTGRWPTPDRVTAPSAAPRWMTS